MQFKLSQLATIIMASLTLVTAAPTADTFGPAPETVASNTVGLLTLTNNDILGTTDEVSTTDYRIGIAWMGPSRTGTSIYMNVDTIPSSCMNINSPYDNNMSSLYLVGGLSCNFWTGRGCSGGGFTLNSANGVTVTNMGSYDNVISSYKCKYY